MNKSKEHKFISSSHGGEWKGLSLDELRYQKAFTLARLEIQKEKMLIGMSQLKEEVPGVNKHGIFNKILGSLNYLDYGILAYRFSTKIFSMIRAVKRR